MAARNVAVLSFEVEYDPDFTDADAVASAMDQLIETALSTPGILDEYGPVHQVGEVLVVKVRAGKPRRRR